MSLSGLKDHPQSLRYWNTAETGGGSWSGAQLHSDPMTTPWSWE